MDYASPRFQGDQHLFDILNDPDTGNVKLGPASPADSIQKMQQALLDLGWPELTEPPIVVDNFADGVWGTNTESTIESYKFVFNLRFPPGAFPGLLDAFAGPRTMFHLDFHMVAFDEAAAAVQARVDELAAGGMVISDEDETVTVTRTRMVMRSFTADGTEAAVINHPAHGTFIVFSPIVDHWLDRFHAFGAPLNDEHDMDDGTRQVDFQFGTLQVDANGAVSVVGERIQPDIVY